MDSRRIGDKNRKIVEKQLSSLIKRDVFKDRRVAIFSATATTIVIRDCLKSMGIAVTAVIDSDIRKSGAFSFGVKTYLPDELPEEFGKDCVILTNSRYHEEMGRRMRELGYGNFIRINGYPEKYGASAANWTRRALRALHGCAIASRLYGKYGNRALFVCPYSGIGDIYLIGLYFKRYVEERGIADYIFAVVNQACREVAELFGIRNIALVGEPDMTSIRLANASLGDSIVPLTLLNDSFAHTNGRWLARGLHGIDFAQMYRRSVFQLPEGTPMSFPERGAAPTSREAERIFAEAGLKKGRTAILAPYANTLMYELPPSFWSRLAATLASGGYVACTNSCGEKEPPIDGTVPVFFPLSHFAELLEMAGCFIGIRSGLCDVASGAACVKIILYPKDMCFGAGTYYSYFSLNRMGLCSDAVEIEYETSPDGIARLADRIADTLGAAG
jgi:hypothetical protein